MITEKAITAKKKVVKAVVNGEITRVRKGKERSNKPVVLPQNITWLKQPNLITLMSGDFKTLQIRVLISLVEKLQGGIEDSLKKVPFQQMALFEDYFKSSNKPKSFSFTIAYKDLGIEPNQYGELKEALKKLASIQVELDTKDPISGADSWSVTGLFKPYIPKVKHSKTFTIEMEENVLKTFLNIDKGFTKFIKEIAFSSQSKYTVRMYMLISSWKDRGGFSITIDKFRHWLQLGEKYVEYKDVYKRIIRPVYEELFEKADCWFEVAEIYRPGEAKPYKLNFKVVKSALSNQEKELLETQIKNLSGIMFQHLKMQDKHISQIIPLINLSNYMTAINKVSYLASKVKAEWKEITDIPAYCTVALIKCLEGKIGIVGEPEESEPEA